MTFIDLIVIKMFWEESPTAIDRIEQRWKIDDRSWESYIFNEGFTRQDKRKNEPLFDLMLNQRSHTV